MYDSFWFGLVVGVVAFWLFQRWQARQGAS